MMATEKSKKKPKKSASDKLKQERGHPPDDHQQVPNLKPVSEKRKRKRKERPTTTDEFLPHGSLVVPMKPAPPGALLTLVGTFLKSYDFHDTSRMYNTELALRRELDEWKSELRAKPPDGLPDLVTLYKGWYKGHQRKAKPDAKSSVKTGNQGIDAVSSLSKNGKKNQRADGRTGRTSGGGGTVSSDGSSSESNSAEDASDTKMKDVRPIKTEHKKATRSLSSSNSSLISESDADDEKEAHTKKISPTKKGENETSINPKRKLSPRRSMFSESFPCSGSLGKKPDNKTKPQHTEAVGNSFSKNQEEKKKPRIDINAALSSSSSSSSTSSSSESSSAEEAAPDPWAQSTTKLVPPVESSSSDSSSSEEARSSSKASSTIKKPNKKTKPLELAFPTAKSSTDSSVTLGHSSPFKASANAALITSVPSERAAPSSLKRPLPTSSDNEATLDAAQPVKKPRNTPFKRVPSDTEVDPKLASNAYRGHDYGDKAHQVLSAQRGKYFTKEKNKKKNSYFGGAIDISGGRAVKF